MAISSSEFHEAVKFLQEIGFWQESKDLSPEAIVAKAKALKEYYR